mgnify:CR=1 FL=1
MTAEIVSKIKITDLALEYGAQKGKGTPNYHCCFHHPDKNPSLSLDNKKGFYNCFGCGKEGNIIDFLAEAEHISKDEAIKRLKERAGISSSHFENRNLKILQNINDIDFRETILLKRYISSLGKIRARTKTGLCATHQRHTAKAVKRARHLGLLSAVSK